MLGDQLEISPLRYLLENGSYNPEFYGGMIFYVGKHQGLQNSILRLIQSQVFIIEMTDQKIKQTIISCA